ncbi:arsenite transporter, ACR3 family, partial [Jhaorihella thermophila]
VVGVLIEVPVMLSVVKIVNATKPWYERGPAVRKVGAKGRLHT